MGNNDLQYSRKPYFCHMDVSLLHSWKGIMEGMLHDELLLATAASENEWFTTAFIRTAISAMLPWWEGKAFETLRGRYPKPSAEKRIGLILAGNLPLVGLHDVLMAMLSGHRVVVKPSHKDRSLLTRLIKASPAELQSRISLAEQIHPDDIDFLVATGTNHTARQIEASFGEVPKLIRRNRFSVAVLRGDESDAQLQGLAMDVLLHHGMGCRNASTVIVPKGYSFDQLIRSLDGVDERWFSACWWEVLRYERALRGMLGFDDLHCNHICLQRGSGLKPGRIGVLNLVEYDSEVDAARQLEAMSDDLQCIIGEGYTPFGMGQFPRLDEFADGVDTLDILAGL
ncbi:MAG: hypothetical protein RLZZ165_2288 [Bacteroidota bacterium]